MYQGERFNSITHLLGLILALAGAAALVHKAVSTGDALMLASFAVFGLSMVVLYGASSLYHSTRDAKAKALWAKVDHCAIYLLIAGTYTPFTLLTLRGVWGWSLFGVVWALAVLGMAKELWIGRDKIPSLPLYLLMGWAALAAAVPLVRQLPGAGLVGLVAGGVLYTLGVPFYVKSDRWRHAHGVWHLFVLGGTAAHFVTVINFVA
jgi:hemolysin III